jgi:hypothetical protein
MKLARRMVGVMALAVVAMVAGGACGGAAFTTGGGGVGADAGLEAGADTSTEASPEASAEAGPETGADAGCTSATSCPAAPTCMTAVCTGGACSTTPSPKGTACSANGGVVCDGSGLCVTCTGATDTNCGGTCPPCAVGKDCKVDKDCRTGFCDNGVCAACSTGTQCTSGFCVDDVCCDQACTGTCQGCAAVLTGVADGTCSSYLGGATAPSGQCTPAPPCGNDGKCAAGGVCEQAPNTTACGMVSCSSATLTPAGQCSGTGSCNLGPGTPCPGDLQCANNTSCLTTCSATGTAGDANCISGYYCNGVGCQQKHDLGEACTAPDECGSGFCADGVCCNVACTGTCEACNLSGATLGTCGQEPNGDNNPDHPCTGSQTCCNGLCLGNGATCL